MARATRSSELTKQFEAKYPNVTVDVQFRDFASWIKQARLVAAGDDPPDVFAGNQGYQLDGELVKAGLILPLDKYSEAYGWEESFTPETLQQFSWGDDGATFGEGRLYGVAQTGQSVGVFANKKKLDAAGVDPATLETFDDFQDALATLRESLPADEPVVALGNKDQYGAIHLWGGIQGAYTPAQDVRDWIFHKEGATFDTEGNLKSLQVLKEWADKGYLGQGDSFNARNDSEAAAAFGKGEGAMVIGGNWNAATARDGLGEDAIFFNMPPGESGDAVAIGSASVPCTSRRSRRTPTSPRRTSTSSPAPTRGRRWSTRRRCRRRRTRRPSRPTSSARTSRPAGTGSSSPAA